jgi:protein gp37
MSDLFHEDVDDSYIEQVCNVMLAANWHTYQVLTKRADRLLSLLRNKLKTAASAPHIWWGVSVEDQKYGLPRIDQLRTARAASSFLSIEPLLEDLGEFDLAGVDWVIVGGESGRGARPLRKQWVRNIRKQCRSAKVPFFFKQWGGVRKNLNGRTLDGRTYDEFPKPSSHQVASLNERRELIATLAPA